MNFRHRGNRGGVKKRMAMGGVVGLGVLGGPGPMRSFPRVNIFNSEEFFLLLYSQLSFVSLAAIAFSS